MCYTNKVPVPRHVINGCLSEVNILWYTFCQSQFGPASFISIDIGGAEEVNIAYKAQSSLKASRDDR